MTSKDNEMLFLYLECDIWYNKKASKEYRKSSNNEFNMEKVFFWKKYFIFFYESEIKSSISFTVDLTIVRIYMGI